VCHSAIGAWKIRLLLMNSEHVNVAPNHGAVRHTPNKNVTCQDITVSHSILPPLIINDLILNLEFICSCIQVTPNSSFYYAMLGAQPHPLAIMFCACSRQLLAVFIKKN
jgi:hypothetical protein